MSERNVPFVSVVAAAGLLSFAVGCGNVSTQDQDLPDAKVDMTSDAMAEVPDAADEETEGPETELTAQPTDPTNRSSARFEFTSDAAGATFECSLDSGDFAACSSPHTMDVDEGSHTFRVVAIAEGVRDASPVLFTWDVDLTPPATTITVAPAALDNSASPMFEFLADEVSTFQCAVDGAAPAECASPFTITGPLSDAAHEFSVYAVDRAGNADLTPATYAWSIDTSAPDTQILKGPVGAVRSTKASFGFASPDVGRVATFECALDGAPFAACTSPVVLDSLAEGQHEFLVRVTDAAGNVDPSPASRIWTVDTVVPVIEVSEPENGKRYIRITEIGVKYSASSDAEVTCQLQYATEPPPPFAKCPPSYGVSRFGAYVLTMLGVDAAGNSTEVVVKFANAKR